MPPNPPPPSSPTVPASQRTSRWGRALGTRHADGLHRAHAGRTGSVTTTVADRARREALEADLLAHGATVAVGGGDRASPEPADPLRTCFEVDRDRILHSAAFRRLAGKTQVFIFPGDHQRTRLTHALEVAQVATAVARACRLNVALTEAIALAHDCGHGPGGHASEDALSVFVPGGYDHAVWGADRVLAPLNLCRETADGIRNHSWSRPAPATPEGEVVSWADRIAYVCHDFEDAVQAGVVTADQLPDVVAKRCGTTRGEQIGAFVGALVSTIAERGVVAMHPHHAEALAAFRSFNHEHIYLRPASIEQAATVVTVLRALVEHLVAHPELLDGVEGPRRRDDPVLDAVTYVGGMTDRFACRLAVQELDWPVDQLPRGFDVFG
jgi:dGTPase